VGGFEAEGTRGGVSGAPSVSGRLGQNLSITEKLRKRERSKGDTRRAKTYRSKRTISSRVGQREDSVREFVRRVPGHGPLQEKRR